MIEMLFFIKNLRGFKPGTSILFKKGVNLLVGDQGCGKSTILMALVEHGGVKKGFWKRDRKVKEATMLLMKDPKRVFAHDFENDSGRTAPAFDVMGMLPLEMSVSHMHMSHGQATRDIMNVAENAKDAYIILDEPDSGISNRTSMKLVKQLTKMAENGCQVIASVHHPWVIEAFPEVYSIEHRAWMGSTEFLKTQQDEPVTPPDPTAEDIALADFIDNKDSKK